MISFSLGHNSTSWENIVKSWVIFGGVDDTQYVGDLLKLPLSAPHWWAPSVDAIAYGGSYLGKFDRSFPKYGLIDTGAAFIYLPT